MSAGTIAAPTLNTPFRRAAEDGVWDVVMVAFHMMHQNARTQVFPRTIANRVGTLLMFAVRNIFSRPERLAGALRELTASGQLPRWLADGSGFLWASDAGSPEWRLELRDPAGKVVRSLLPPGFGYVAVAERKLDVAGRRIPFDAHHRIGQFPAGRLLAAIGRHRLFDRGL